MSVILKTYRPALSLDGSDAPLTAFTLTAEPGKLGYLLSAQLADTEQVFQRGDACDFNLHGTGANVARLIKDGFVTSKSAVTASARERNQIADALTATASDRFGERSDLAPETPVVLFDPAFTSLSEDDLDTQINDEAGERIFAEAIEIISLDLYQLLNYAYVVGVGFDSVITNIENYPIPRVDFPLDSSYHDSASHYFMLFKPVVFEDDGVMFIIDPRSPIPDGLLGTIRTVTTSDYFDLERAKPAIARVNAIIVTSRQNTIQTIGDELPENATEELEISTTETFGNFFGQPFLAQRVTETRYVIRFHDDEGNPDKVTGEVDHIIETLTEALFGATFQSITFERQTELYADSFTRNLGYEKNTTAFLGFGIPVEDALVEHSRIDWESTGVAGEYRKIAETVTTRGAVVNDGGERTPLIEFLASNSGVEEGSTIEFDVLISTSTKRYRETGPDQVKIQTNKTNQLTGLRQFGNTTQHTGTIRIQTRSNEGKQTRTRILDTDSIAEFGYRKPITFDAGYLLPTQAFELAARILADAQDPPEQVNVTLTTFDGGIRRGSLREVVDRAGTSKNIIVTGWTLTGTPGPRGLCVITQSISGLVI